MAEPEIYESKRNKDLPFEEIEDLNNFLTENHITLEDCIQCVEEIACSSLVIETGKLGRELNNGSYSELCLIELRAKNTEKRISRIHGELNLKNKKYFDEKRLKESRIKEFVELKGKIEKDTTAAASKFIIQAQMNFKNQLEQKITEREPEKREWVLKIYNLKEANASLELETCLKTRSTQRYQGDIAEFKASLSKRK